MLGPAVDTYRVSIEPSDESEPGVNPSQGAYLGMECRVGEGGMCSHTAQCMTGVCRKDKETQPKCSSYAEVQEN